MGNCFICLLRKNVVLTHTLHSCAKNIHSEKHILRRNIMTMLEAVICGLIQGLAEFLPISSSGHLAIVHSFFDKGDAMGNLTFDLLLHLGTLIVVFIFYYSDIFPLIPAFFTMLGKVFRGKFRLADWTKNERYVLFLIIATLPLAAGLLIKDKVELLSLYPKLVGAILIFNGFVLIFADYMTKRVKVHEQTPARSLVIGLFQLCAITPGLSRSGSTISGGLLMGLEREDAVKFSFIMSVPAILGANILSVPEALSSPVASADMGYYLVGMLVAMISGFCAMKFLLYISRKSKFGFFAYYCMAAGLITVIFA